MFTTRIWKLGSLALAAAIVGLACGSDDTRAAKYLVRSLKGDYGVNVVAVMQQRSKDQSNMVIKIERSKTGKTHEIILSPLHKQCEFLNDGKTLQTYSIDEKVLSVQPVSPAEQDFDFRWPLIQKNYILKAEMAKEQFAGRQCILVTASSRYPQVPDIRYFFDVKTGFPLSSETVHPDGNRQTEYEVTHVSFPRDIDPAVFKIDPVIGVEVVNYAEPKCVSNATQAAQALGFSPVLPPRMPLGFQIQKMMISSTKNVKTLCLKLTDGLQRVTVYQWLPSRGEVIKTGEDSVIRMKNGVKILVVSDIDPGVRESIVRTFMVRADRDNQPMITSIGYFWNSAPL